MSDTTANWQDRRFPSFSRELTSLAHPRADQILARAERREAPSAKAIRVSEHVTLDKMDTLAIAVASIMAIGPLLAAYLGSLMVSS